jgi:hypothetical protein
VSEKLVRGGNVGGLELGLLTLQAFFLTPRPQTPIQDKERPSHNKHNFQSTQKKIQNSTFSVYLPDTSAALRSPNQSIKKSFKMSLPKTMKALR